MRASTVACLLLSLAIAACGSRRTSPQSPPPPPSESTERSQSHTTPKPPPGTPPAPPQSSQPGTAASSGAVATTGATQFASINGARLYFEFSGPASAQTIILIHHFTLDGRMWDDQFAEFAKRFKVLRYDARGFGRSSPVSGTYSPVADLRALMDSLGIARAHLVGHSMGARFAIDFALTYPERVQTLTLSDASISGAAFSSAFTREFVNATAPAKSGNLDEAKRRWLASSLFGSARQKPAVIARVREMVNGYSGWHFVNEDPATMPKPPAISQLSKIKAPSLVMVGERSIPDFQRFADRLVREVPIARRYVLRGAGHMGNMEVPAAYNRAVEDFIANPPTVGLSVAERNPALAPAACVDPVTKRPATNC